MSNTTSFPFVKMHGLGNDFAIFDARDAADAERFCMTSLIAKALGNRRTGIGFDQGIVLKESQEADVYMEIWNNDGGEVEACGNASRCIAKILMDEKGAPSCTIETKAGILTAHRKDTLISVDMGVADMRWASVPLYQATDTKLVDLNIEGLPPACCLSVGNPHAVFFVDNVMTVPVEELGPQIEQHWMFPEKVNASFVEFRADHLRVRVWERGVGMTRACGTAACAAMVAANRRDLLGRSATVVLDGGELHVKWQEDGRVIMTGPVSHVYEGVALIPDDESL